MKNLLLLSLTCSLLVSPKSIIADTGLMADAKKVSKVEYLYADVSDANTILATIDSGLLTTYQGKGRAAWEQVYRKKRARLAKELQKLPASGLSNGDTRAIAAMRKQMKSFTGGGALFSPAAKCQDVGRKDIAYRQLKSSLVACFVEIGNNLSFEGGKINRVSALDLLHETADPGRRKAAFLAFVPLWQAINGNNEPDSPYRRMIAGAVAEAAKNGSDIDNAARDVGIDSAELERWLVQILDAWRLSTSDAMIEPWDFRFEAGEADRLLESSIPREFLQPINQRYYRDLGADLEQMGTLYDLSPRPEKAALAYTEFVTHGRMVNGIWRPTVARVSAPYERGGLFVLNELDSIEHGTLLDEEGAAMMESKGTWLVPTLSVMQRYATDARPNRGLDTILPLRVRHDAFVRPVGYLDSPSHLVFAEFLYVEVAHGIGNSTSGHQLYPVGAVLNVVSYRGRDAVHRVSKIGATGQGLVRRQSIRISVTACN